MHRKKYTKNIHIFVQSLSLLLIEWQQDDAFPITYRRTDSGSTSKNLLLDF